MIELGRKFPSPENIEQIARALEIDTPELFSMPPSAEGLAIKFSRDLLLDIEKKVGDKVNNAVKAALSEIVADHLKNINELEKANIPKKKKTG